MKRKKLHRNQQILILFIFSVIPMMVWLVYLDASPDDWDWGRWTVKPELRVPAVERTAEVALCERAIFESRNGRDYHNIVTASIFLKSVPDQHKALEAKTLEHQGEIKSIIREVIGSAGSKQVEDPMLVYVKSEVSRKVGQVVGRTLFSEVLVPLWEVDYPPFNTPVFAPR